MFIRKKDIRLASVTMLAMLSLSIVQPFVSLYQATATTDSSPTVVQQPKAKKIVRDTAPQATRYTVSQFAGYPTDSKGTVPSLNATSGQDMAGATISHSSGKNIIVNTDGNPSNNAWTSGSYWLVKTSTLGYENLQLTSNQKSSAGGPGDYAVEYSTDYDPTNPTAATWQALDGAQKIQVSQAYDHFTSNGNDNNGAIPKVDVSLPSSLANQPQIYLRWKITSPNKAYTAPDKPGAAVASAADGSYTFGTATSRINVQLTGTRFYGKDDVKADLDDGTKVPKGQVVHLSVQDPDATIHYTYNGGADVTASAKTSADVTIDAFSQDNSSATISAYTVDANGNQSTPILYHYFQKQLGAVQASKGNGTAIKPGAPVTLKEPDIADAKIYYTVTTQAGTPNQQLGQEQLFDPSKPLTFTKAQFPVSVTTYAKQDNYLPSDPFTYTWTLDDIDPSTLHPYFGGLHSHTTYSDGIGIPSDAYAEAKADGLDFWAVTDHSNYFENANTTTGPALVTTSSPSFAANMNGAKIPDAGITNTFDEGYKMADDATTDKFVGIYAFEMTWSSGPGHINTFNMTSKDANGNTVPALVSRSNSYYNDKTNNYVCMPRYYDTLSTLAPDSISQYNHPGPTFGNFDDFSYWTPSRDSMLTMVEVGNGEGPVGSSGYFPSYEQYFLALDKGWHVAPTNNQDNHHGHWGDGNDARSVVLAPSLTRANIFDAMKNRRVYATEDKNLALSYTLNGEVMGTEMDPRPDTVNISAEAKDPDTGDNISKIDLMVDGGKVIDSKTFDGTNDATYTYTGPDDYNYYVIRTTEADGNIAISAPVWTGTVEKVGINDLSMAQTMAVKDSKVTLNTNLYNNEAAEFDISKVTYKDGNDTIATVTDPIVMPGTTTKALSYDWIPTTAGSRTVTVTVEGSLNGEAKTYTKQLKVDVKDPSKLAKIAIDGGHNNFYVSDTKYPGKFTTFAQLAAQGNALVTTITDPITKDLLDQYSAFLITAPQLKNLTDDKTYKVYTDDEIAAIKAWTAEPGKTLVVMGTADYTYDSKTDATKHTSTQLNKILSAVGAGARIGDDEVIDDVTHGNVDYRLSFTGKDFNIANNDLMTGMDPSQAYSFYSGTNLTINDDAPTNLKVLVKTHTQDENPTATVAKKDDQGYVIGADGTQLLDTTGKPTQDPAKVADPTKLVQIPYDGTTAIDTDKDGYGVDDDAGTITKAPEGGSPVLTSETLPSGSTVVTAGTAFLSDFETAVDVDNQFTLPSANTTIAKNIIAKVAPVEVTSIKDFLALATDNANEGKEVTIKGVLTTNSSGFKGSDGTLTHAAFAEGSTYIQDDTGSTNIFPLIDANAPKGATVQVTGTIGAYYGEPELRVTSYKIINSTPVEVTPTKVTPEEAVTPASLSKYIQVEGTVTSADPANGKYMIDNVLPVYIDGYITPSVDISNILQVGNKVSVAGLGSRYLTGIDHNEDGTTCMNDTRSDLNLRVVDRNEIKLLEKSKSYSVTYDANGGANAPESSMVADGDSFTISTKAPTMTGYSFEGWFYNGTVYQPADTISGITGDITLVAQWAKDTVKTYTVKYDANGGQNAPENGSLTAGDNFTVSSTVPTRSGYTFEGWSYNNKVYKAGDTISGISSDITLAAQWKEVSTSAPVKSVPIYRLYNKATGEHFYTMSAFEKNADVKAGWTYEGIGWSAPDTGTAVYRVYNPNAKGGDHYYTKSKAEAAFLVKAGWKWDYNGKAVFYSGGNVKVYVAYNPNAQSGSHNYTKSLFEQNSLLKVGWKFGAVAWNAVK